MSTLFRLFVRKRVNARRTFETESMETEIEKIAEFRGNPLGSSRSTNDDSSSFASENEIYSQELQNAKDLFYLEQFYGDYKISGPRSPSNRLPLFPKEPYENESTEPTSAIAITPAATTTAAIFYDGEKGGPFAGFGKTGNDAGFRETFLPFWTKGDYDSCGNEHLFSTTKRSASAAEMVCEELPSIKRRFVGRKTFSSSTVSPTSEAEESDIVF